MTSPLDQKDREMVQGEEAAWAKEREWDGACAWLEMSQGVQPGKGAGHK